MDKSLSWLAAGLLAAGLGGSAAAQSETKRQVKAINLSTLTGQGFEVEAISGRDALIVQKGKDVYWCTLHLANTAPLSYLSECYSTH